jgi:hypothetical protein
MSDNAVKALIAGLACTTLASAKLMKEFTQILMSATLLLLRFR